MSIISDEDIFVKEKKYLKIFFFFLLLRTNFKSLIYFLSVSMLKIEFPVVWVDDYGFCLYIYCVLRWITEIQQKRL